MADDPIVPPPLAPGLGDLLTTTERDVLRAIVRDGDVIDGFKARLLSAACGLPEAGTAWLLIPVSPVLLDALAAFEADDADLEAEPDLEMDHDAEPSLGATNDMNQERAWRLLEVEEIDLEYDGDGVPDADAEPMLGAPENHPSAWGYGRDRSGDQTSWARGAGAMEEEAQDEDGGAIDDEGQGDSFEETGAGCGNCDEEASLSATEDIDQRLAWAAPDNWLYVDDGEATGCEDDLPAPLPTIEQREAQTAAASEAREQAFDRLLRRSGGKPVRIGQELVLLGACDQLGRSLPR